MNKRGEGEQFNWIFVIVAGSILLAFFVIFTFKYIELQEKRQDVDTVMFLGDGVLSASSRIQVGSGGAVVDSNEQDGLRFGYGVKLGSECLGNDSFITINNGDVFYKLKDEVVFMNKELNVDSLDMWVLPWQFPFYVTNFIYLADPKTNFYFVVDSSSNDFVENLDFSSAFKVKKVSGNSFNVEENSKVIYFTNSEPSENNVKKLKTQNIVYINLKEQEVSFFENNKFSDPVKIYFNEDDKGQLIGAIFSNDEKNFKCNIEKSLGRLKIISRNYAERTRILNQINRDQECRYNLIANSLIALSQAKEDEILPLVGNIKEQNIQGACIWVY